MTQATVTRVRRIAIVVGDLAIAERFFAEAFAFETVSRASEEPDLPALLGTPETLVRQTLLRLGEQELALLTFDPPGRPYPGESTSTDLWFQHFAIVVSDMDAAYRRLQATGRFTAISEGGPQVLPPSSGSVSAFKFRDAEGHPLELLAFPPGKVPPPWRSVAPAGLFLGIDHSAVAVGDTARSIGFYRDCLGLTLGEQTGNQGVEQSRLDAVADAKVTVTSLKPSRVGTPHVELLGYQVGTRRPIAEDSRSQDLASSFFVLETDALEAMVETLTLAGARFLSPGIVSMSSGTRAIAILDPDGHRLVVTEV